MNNRRSTLGRIFMICVIVCLVAVLAELLLYNRQIQKARSASLAQEAAQTNTNDPNVKRDPKAEKTQNETPAAAEESKPEETAAGTKKEGKAEPTPAVPTPQEQKPAPAQSASPEAETQETAPVGFSIRGDDFSEDIVDPTSGYAARLKILLEDDYPDISVEDNTWEMAGTLSQMALAGVSDAEIQTYIESHSEYAASNSVEVPITDLKVRADLLEKITARDDQEYVPIIMTGYYGGWGTEPEELAEQIRKILDTYNDPENYIVAGVYPYRYNDTDHYDRVMREAFGTHYLQMNEATGRTGAELMSPEGRQAIAEALLERIEENGLTR